MPAPEESCLQWSTEGEHKGRRPDGHRLEETSTEDGDLGVPEIVGGPEVIAAGAEGGLQPRADVHWSWGGGGGDDGDGGDGGDGDKN